MSIRERHQDRCHKVAQGLAGLGYVVAAHDVSVGYRSPEWGIEHARKRIRPVPTDFVPGTVGEGTRRRVERQNDEIRRFLAQVSPEREVSDA